jgi:hypothetical protein
MEPNNFGNKFLRGIIPLGTNFCGVPDVMEQISAGYQMSLNKFLYKQISVGYGTVSYPTEQTSEDYDTHLHSVADPDPGSGTFLPPQSGIRDPE